MTIFNDPFALTIFDADPQRCWISVGASLVSVLKSINSYGRRVFAPQPRQERLVTVAGQPLSYNLFATSAVIARFQSSEVPRPRQR